MLTLVDLHTYMGKMLRFQDKVLLSLAFIGDAAVDFVKTSEKARRQRWVFYSTLLPWEENTFYRSCSALIRSKDIKKEIRNGEPYIVLSSGGQDNYERRFPLLNWRNRKWNGEWCIVSYDVPESTSYIRDSLREKLRSLGFGLWQRSVYISPYSFLRSDLLEFVKLNNLEEFVSVTVAKDLSGGNERRLARDVFNLEDLGEQYDDLLSDLRDAEPDEIKVLYDSYLSLLTDKDPLLPRELLPENWSGFKVVSKLKSILKGQKMSSDH